MTETGPLRTIRVDCLSVEVYASPDELGSAAAGYTARTLQEGIAHNGRAVLILATGSSQFAFLAALRRITTVDWDRISVFHLDEYVGMPDRHPASFRRYLRERILDEVRPAQIYFLEGDAPDLEAEVRRYGELLAEHSVDLACIGIGENGHLAFNDPPVADFHDPKRVKVVELDSACRRQQLGEGWFASLEDVPTHALTLTIPSIMQSRCISCVVPDERKAVAVAAALEGPIDTACPASILRRHPNARLFLDRAAASHLRR